MIQAPRWGSAWLRLAVGAGLVLAETSPASAENANAPTTEAPAHEADAASSASAPDAAPALTEPTTASSAPLAETLQGQPRLDYETGRLLYQSGDYAGALLQFRKAHDQAGDPRLLWNAAACERSLRHYVKACQLVRRFLASRSPLITPEAAARAQAFLDAAEPLTAPLAVESSRPSSEVYLDDELLGRAPLAPDARIDLGTHRIVVKAVGFQPYSATLTVVSSAKVEVVVLLRPVETSLSLRTPKPHRQEPRPASERSSLLPTWAWVAGGGLLLAGAATAGYFIFKPETTEPMPGSIATYRF